MKVYVMGSSVGISTVVSLDELKLLAKKAPDALRLIEGEGKEKHEVFKVFVGEKSELKTWGACFNGSTNGDPKCAMMTLDISAKPEEMSAKEYVAEMYGVALLNLQKVEEQFKPALEDIAVKKATLADMIEEITL